jgi:hypothetical protein
VGRLAKAWNVRGFGVGWGCGCRATAREMQLLELPGW